MPRAPLDYGVYAQAFRLRPDGKLSPCGGDLVLFFDQRLSRFNMADLARDWASKRGFDAYRLMSTHDGFRAARPIGATVILNGAALHAEYAS